MRFQEFEERIKAITTSVVAIARNPLTGNQWLENKCSDVCGDLMERIRTELGGVDTWEFVKTTGFWTGDIPEGCCDKHEWMCIRFNEQELIFDPTYIQYTRTEWSWDGCKQAVVDNCYTVLRDDVRCTKAYKERASLYPLYKKG
jgi:hypothetical protein